jgi:hypothetical protein
LKKQIATLTAAQPKKGRRGRKTHEEAQAPEAQIAKYGGYFQAAYEPWIELDVLMKPLPDVEKRNATGFGTTDAENADRITSELLGLLPRALQVVLQTEASARKAVCSLYLPLYHH